MAEYYIETGKPSSGSLGAMGHKLCKGLEAANNARGPASSRFSLTMNEPSFDRRPAHATDRSGPAVFDAMVPSIYPVCLRPRCNAAMRFSTDSDDPGPRYTDQRHRRLLRARHQWPRRYAAEQRDELAAFHAHSITSSARASSMGGTSRPSALAVLRLITNSYLVGACTGRSAGFSPFWMPFT